MRHCRLLLATGLLLSLAACGPTSPEADGGDGNPADVTGSDLASAGGAWEGVSFDGGQVIVTLDLVAHADLHTLDVDVALDSRAAQAIVAARPHTMAQLAATQWVGGSALTRIRAYLPVWQENVAVETYDGVSFTHLEAARALAAANSASSQQISAAGITSQPAAILTGGRPWLSLAAVAAKTGIGPTTVGRLKTLGASFPNAASWWLDAAGEGSLDSTARTALSGDAAFEASLEALVADETADPSWNASIASMAIQHLGQGVDAFGLLAIGRTYAGADAAHADFTATLAGMETTSTTGYPAGLLHFVPHATQAQQLVRAKIAMVHYFEHTLIDSPEWIGNIGLPWSAVADTVTTEAASFEHESEYEVYPQYQGVDQTLFVGSLDQLHTEVSVDGVGKVTHVLIEID